MWLFVGLGNPGDKYANNRHNIGFMIADLIAQNNAYPPFCSKFKGEFTEGRLGSSAECLQKIGVLKPLTYMNESGQSVVAAAKFFKIAPERIVVLHDELDMAPGKIRVKCGGGNAGHNGLKSIQSHLGTADFWRVRIGIGHPGDRNKVSNYVLSDFSKAEAKWLGPLLNNCARYADLLLGEDKNNFSAKVSSSV